AARARADRRLLDRRAARHARADAGDAGGDSRQRRPARGAAAQSARRARAPEPVRDGGRLMSGSLLADATASRKPPPTDAELISGLIAVEQLAQEVYQRAIASGALGSQALSLVREVL